MLFTCVLFEKKMERNRENIHRVSFINFAKLKNTLRFKIFFLKENKIYLTSFIIRA